MVSHQPANISNGSPDGYDAARSTSRPAIGHDLFCPDCGYNLRGVTSDRCPECGYGLQSIRSDVSGIPWVHRKKLGWFRAYWKTVALVMFRQKRFCDEMARPVSYPDSQRFRWVTIVHAYVPVLLATLFVYLTVSPKPEPSAPFAQMLPAGMIRSTLSLPEQAYVEVWPMAILHLCFLLFLGAATGVPSYFFHPRNVPTPLQNRAVALSYYMCGPLALTVLPIITVGVAFHVVSVDRWCGRVYLLAGILLGCLVVLWSWRGLVQLAKRTMPQVEGRSVIVAMTIPLLWLVLLGLCLICLPFIVLSVLVAFASLG